MEHAHLTELTAILVVYIICAIASQVVEAPLLAQVVATGIWAIQTITDRPSVSG